MGMYIVLNETIKLWAHQKAAVAYMLKQKRGILNAGMRTGKTLASLAYSDEAGYTRTIIVAKSKHSLDVWSSAIRDAFSDRAVIVNHNHLSIDEQAALVKNYNHNITPLFYLTTYPRIWRPKLLKALMQGRYQLIVADESHKISANNSATSKALYKLGLTVQSVWGLTGTLISNAPMGIFGQARFVNANLFNFPDDPQLLKAFYRFRARYCHLRPISPRVSIVTGYKNMDEFNAEVGKFVYKIDSADVLDLPPAMHIKHPIVLPKGIMNAYKALKNDAIIQLGTNGPEAYTNGSNQDVMSVKNILTKIGRMRQLTGGTVTTDDKRVKWVHDEKLDAMEDIVNEITDADGDEPIVIFAAYSAEIAHIKERLQKLGSVSELSGQKNELDTWQRGNTRFLVVQISTGAEAIDLTRAGNTIYYSLDYSLATYLQSAARTTGVKQTRRQINYYYLLATGTIDTLIFKALETKQNVAKTVLDSLEGWGD